MQVFKFGGASVKDADGVANLGRIVTTHSDSALLIVVSAMGKSTNLLEKLVQQYVSGTDEAAKLLEETKQYHREITQRLFPDSCHPVHNEVANRFVEIEWILDEPALDPYDYLYDQI